MASSAPDAVIKITERGVEEKQGGGWGRTFTPNGQRGRSQLPCFTLARSLLSTQRDDPPPAAAAGPLHKGSEERLTSPAV